MVSGLVQNFGAAVVDQAAPDELAVFWLMRE